MSHGALVLEETGEALRRNPTLLEKAYLGEIGDNQPAETPVIGAPATTD